MKKNLIFNLFLILFFSSTFSNATIIYVSTSGSGTGRSWADAASDLQLAIYNSNSGDDIWVAKGIYKPNRRADAIGTITTDDRNNAFVLKKGVKIYGGFAGNETQLSDRNWITNVTTLSGDLGTIGVDTDNAYHVVISADKIIDSPPIIPNEISSEVTAELNGFTITGGCAVNESTYITVNSNSIYKSNGGAIYITSSALELNNLSIIGNQASALGCGVYISGISKAVIKGDLTLSNGATINASTKGSTVEFAGVTVQNLLATNFTDNKIYNLIINNSNNVMLFDTLYLLNAITSTSGKLDANTNTPTLSYSGSSAQVIDSFPFLDGKVYNLTIDNSSGVSLETDFEVENIVTINSEKKLTIPVTKELIVNGTIANYAGVSGLVIKSSSDAANGTLIFHNTNDNPVLATVEMYTKAYYDANGAINSKYKWQFFGVPVRSISANPTFNGSYVRQYDEPTSSWLTVTSSTILKPVTGYEITQVNPKTIYFQGELVNGDITRNLTYTSGNGNAGLCIISNPYTVAIDIKEIDFNCIASVYLYNTGSSTDWSANSDDTSPGNSPGQYVVSPQSSAGILGIPTQIPSMQGFMVGALNESCSINFNYNNVAVKESTLQRVKWMNSTVENKTATSINLKGAHSGDKMWLITDPSCTDEFDNGYDGYKVIGSSSNSSIYAVGPDGNYQVSAVSDINNTELMFKSGVDSLYTISFTHQNLSSTYSALYLIDVFENKIIDISQDNTSYSFTAIANSTPQKRFKIVTNTDITTEIETPTKIASVGIRVFFANKTIHVLNSTSKSGHLFLYDINGRLVSRSDFNSDVETTIPLNLKTGVYCVKAESFTNKFTMYFQY